MPSFPKPEPRARTRGRVKRLKHRTTADVRAYVFARERNVCRCCRVRVAESMHELRFRSLGGKVSRRNSVALCGDGVFGCHGYMQRNQIDYMAIDEQGAEGPLIFIPQTKESADWMRVRVNERLESLPMVQMEAAE